MHLILLISLSDLIHFHPFIDIHPISSTFISDHGMVLNAQTTYIIGFKYLSGLYWIGLYWDGLDGPRYLAKSYAVLTIELV